MILTSRETDTGSVTSVATQSNSSRVPDICQNLLILPCLLRQVTGQRVCKRTKRANSCQAHVHSCFSCCSCQYCSLWSQLASTTYTIQVWKLQRELRLFHSRYRTEGINAWHHDRQKEPVYKEQTPPPKKKKKKETEELLKAGTQM